MERAVLLADGAAEIGAEHLGLAAVGVAVEARNLDEPTREQLVGSLARHAGNVSRVASEFGLSRQAVYRRMAHHGV
jgi:transcriptional regulator of acetoin/glycerol metabolism